ncbi:hypothetical protein BC829DRAFT_452761 [Chytridium lagenaria]|nr:hypothetical protein BC829DRAFT_452761 [Chytridium lagenaria]
MREVVKGNVNRACGEVCGKKQSCGIHTCPTLPRWSLPECPITNDHLCRCGKTHVTLPCGTSPDQDVLCRKPCGIAFRCGEHLCELVCHDARNHGTVLPGGPGVIETCPCGRTKVETLLGRNRESCTEGIPTCKAKCARKLACGHQCERLCHIGECPPCSVEIERICRCGSSRVFMKCASTLDKNAGVQDFLCDRICKSNRLCKRHKCNSVCCPGTEGVHACNAMCGKLLRCGQHNCNFVCGHNGPCHDCYEGVSFDELACACGRTRMYPPIPCGTLPPKCDLPCQRELPCGHVSYSVHTCHPDDEPCPPCVVFVEKQCACGKKVMGNIPCSRQSALSCGSPCLQTLAACGHQCKRFCHNGPCLEEGTRCQGKCLRARPMCGHVCDQLCHETSFCTEERPCKTPIQQTCPCGNRNSDIPCGAWKESIGNPRGAHLPCDESCARLDRNKRLADALNITPSTEAPKPLEVYEEYLHRFALANPAIVKTTEQTLQEFLANPSRKLLHFPHANPRTNRFVAGIVEHYGLTAEVIDAERKQASVVARKAGKGGWAVPNPLLSVACKTFKGKSAAAVVISRTGGLSFSVKTATAFNGVTANGFFVMGLQDGIETKDIEIITEPIVGPISVCWVGENGDCIILPACLSQKTPASGHNLLIDKEPSLTSIFLYNAWATSVHLCRTEDDGTVIRFLPSAWQDKPATSKAWQLPMKTARQVVSQSNPYAALAGNDGSVAAVATVQVVKVDETPTPEDWEEALAEPTVESSWADSV